MVICLTKNVSLTKLKIHHIIIYQWLPITKREMIEFHKLTSMQLRLQTGTQTFTLMINSLILRSFLFQLKEIRSSNKRMALITQLTWWPIKCSNTLSIQIEKPSRSFRKEMKNLTIYSSIIRRSNLTSMDTKR